MQRLYLFAFFLLFAGPLRAEDELQRYVEFQAHQAETVLGASQLAMMEATDFVERHPDATESEMHRIFREYVEKTRSLRAIIMTDSEGNLKVDSFMFPARAINLKDRAYVKASLTATQKALYIGKPIQGRTSGMAFVPMSRPILDIRDQSIGSITGILTPESLIRQDMICAHCFVAVFNSDNEIIVSYPSDVTYPEDFQTLFKDEDKQFIKKHKAGSHLAQSWIYRLADYGVRVTLTQLKPGE